MLTAILMTVMVCPQQAQEKPPYVDQIKVDEAIARGVKFLRAQEKAITGWGEDPRNFHVRELVLLTLDHAGVPEDDPLYIKLFDEMLESKLERTYQVAIQAMILERVDRVAYQWRILKCAQFLVDNMAKNGQWSYGTPSFKADDLPTGDRRRPEVATKSKDRKTVAGKREKPKLRRRIPVIASRTGPERGDNSNTQYAALGIRACFDAGIVFPKNILRKAKQWWISSQKPRGGTGYGGFCYGDHKTHEAYGSMTAGGVGALAIYEYIDGKDWKKDRRTQQALNWLAENFAVKHNPGTHEHGKKEKNGQHHYFYYMYGLERAGMLFGTEKIGKHWWYSEGAEELLKRQNAKGAWGGNAGRGAIIKTCFAILFLRRATEPLESVASGKTKKRR